MKKLFGLMFLSVMSVFLFSSCSEDDDTFDYPMESIYGKWKGTEVYYNEEWLDLSDWVYQELSFTITFYDDGTYYGEGFFGTGYGTYEAIGKNITTYVDGKKYLTYYVKSLSNDKAEITMYDNSGESMDVRVQKIK